MLFSSEIWGYELKPDTNVAEKLFNKFCKHILGVHRNITNLAIQGELGTFRLLIDVKINMVLYYLYLRQLNNHLITDALSENEKIHAQNNNRRSWISMVKQVISENHTDITSYQYKTRRYKSAITKLRCSVHRLKIEIGRYNRIRNEVTGKMEPLPKVEDEYHCLVECQVNKKLRDKFLNEMNSLIGDNFKTMNHFAF